MDKQKVVADTSALVSLELAEVLGPSTAVVSWVVPEAVVAELRELSEMSDAVGRAAKKALALTGSKGFEVLSVRPLPSVLKRVDEGEACAFSLCVQEKINVLVCDNVNAAYRLDGLAQVHDVRMVIGAAVIVELVRQKTWSKKQAVEAVSKMVASRGWESGVLDSLSKKYLQDL